MATFTLAAMTNDTVFGKQFLSVPTISLDCLLVIHRDFARNETPDVCHNRLDLPGIQIIKGGHDPARTAIANGFAKEVIIDSFLKGPQGQRHTHTAVTFAAMTGCTILVVQVFPVLCPNGK